MNFPKLAMLSGLAAISLVAATPAQATWYTYNSNAGGGWSTSGGWHVSGWGNSGWGASGWGSSGWASSSFGGGTSSSTSTSSSSGGSSSGGTPVPEPSNMLMLALGVAGLVAGRFAARRKRDK